MPPMSPLKQHDAGSPVFIAPQIFANDPVIAGFSTRQGGSSQKPFDSLNLGKSTGDAPERVENNRERLFAMFNVSPARMALCGQVHGTNIMEADRPGLFPGFDGMVSATPNVLLTLTAADCASVLFYDPVRHIAGACHAGWRGTVGNIVNKTLLAMEKKGSNLASIKAYVSPCISSDHFEVGPELIPQFDPRCVIEPGIKGPKYHVDLKKALHLQLLEAGITPDHIEIDLRCTYADLDLFFSYRAEKGTTGRMMGFIGLL